MSLRNKSQPGEIDTHRLFTVRIRHLLIGTLELAGWLYTPSTKALENTEPKGPRRLSTKLLRTEPKAPENLAWKLQKTRVRADSLEWVYCLTVQPTYYGVTTFTTTAEGTRALLGYQP